MFGVIDPIAQAAYLLTAAFFVALSCAAYILFVLLARRQRGVLFYLAFVPLILYAIGLFQNFVQPHLYDRDIRAYLAEPLLGTPVPADDVRSIHIVVPESDKPFRTFFQICQKVDERAKSCTFKVNELQPTDNFETIVAGTGPYTVWQRHDDIDTCVELHGWNGLNDPP